MPAAKMELRARDGQTAAGAPAQPGGEDGAEFDAEAVAAAESVAAAEFVAAAETVAAAESVAAAAVAAAEAETAAVDSIASGPTE